MASSKANVAASTLTTRQKKMAEMCSLMKYFIRCANKRACTVVTTAAACALVSWAWCVQTTPGSQSDSLCRRAAFKVQRAAETRDGGPAERLQLCRLWQRLQQSPGEGHPRCAQVLV